ncbi:MAG TPA: GtrA family protein [Thermomicrobiales bacterium]|nr:GtrA family protein [Thermomicrobiales bacterium]HRA47119.1 GtrA family protein [Thermomicrobiales bacterium]
MISAAAFPDRANQALSVARRFQKFLVVGAIGLAVNQIMLIVFHDGLSTKLAVASVLAIAVSMIVTFILNEVWTWHDRGSGMLYHRLAKYIPINTIGLAINTVVLLILVERYDVHKLIANLVGAGLAAIWNFCLNSMITWRA